MDTIIAQVFFVFALILERAQVNRGNVYGYNFPPRQSYLRPPTQYAAQQQESNSIPVRRPSYSPLQQRTYASAYPRQSLSLRSAAVTYTAAQPRTYTSVHRGNITPLRPRVYLPVSQGRYAQVGPRTYSPIQPRPSYGTSRLNSYSPVTAATRASVQRSPWYPTAKPRVAYYARPVTNSVARQPVRVLPVQRPFTRTFTPRVQWYRTQSLSSPYPQRYVAAQRSGVPVRFTAYGRSKIPKKSSSKSSVPRNSDKPMNRGTVESRKVNLRNENNKRNNIVRSENFGLQSPRGTSVARNHINGIALPSKFLVNEHAQIQPMHPLLNLSKPRARRLSTFLKNMKSLRDAFKGDRMKQNLIYYNDDITNKIRHRPTGFAPPTRKLGSQGAPGGSRVTLLTESDKVPGMIGMNFASYNPAYKRRTIENDTGKIPRETIPGSTSPGKASPRVMSPGKMTPAVKTPTDSRTVVFKASEDLNVTMKGNLSTTEQNKTGATQLLSGKTTVSEKPLSFDNPKVDLGLLKEKVLHSNNSQFLQRVLLVLRKYTKLMESSMAEKNRTYDQSGSRFSENATLKHLNTSATEIQDQNTTSIRREAEKSNSVKANATFKNPQEIPSTNNNDLVPNSANKTRSNFEENPLGLANALNSTKTAVKVFDMLNAASNHSSERYVTKESQQTENVRSPKTRKPVSAKLKNSTNTTGSVSDNAKTAPDLMLGNASSESQASNSAASFAGLKDENASKKEIIETEHNLGKPVFNVERLKYGLERGNTID